MYTTSCLQQLGKPLTIQHVHCRPVEHPLAATQRARTHAHTHIHNLTVLTWIKGKLFAPFGLPSEVTASDPDEQKVQSILCEGMLCLVVSKRLATVPDAPPWTSNTRVNG